MKTVVRSKLTQHWSRADTTCNDLVYAPNYRRLSTDFLWSAETLSRQPLRR